MSCHHFTSKDGSVRGFISLPDIYAFKGYTFEWHTYLGATPVCKRTLNPRKTTPAGFFKMVDKWMRLSDRRREQCMIYP